LIQKCDNDELKLDTEYWKLHENIKRNTEF